MPTISGTVYDDAGAPAAGRIVRAYRRDTGALLGEAVTGTGLPIAGDTHYANVSLLLHCDGADGSTVFSDSSAAPKTFTASGNAKISTAQSKFGGASGYFDGAGDEVYTSNGDVAAGSVLTMEAWVYITENPPAFPGWSPILGQGGTGGDTDQVLAITSDCKLRFYKGSGVGGAVIDVSSAAAAVPLNAWTHVAATLDGTTARVFVNGVLAGSVAATSSWVNTGQPFRIGRAIVVNYESYQGYFKGWIDELRITKGVARNTASFAPPTAPHPNSVDATPEPEEGSYSITTAYTGEVQRIVLDDDAGTLYNDLIDRVVLA